MPVALTATAWGAVFIAIGLYFDVPRLFEEPRWRSASLVRAGAGVLALFYGCVLLIGAALSDYGPLQPLISIGVVGSSPEAGGTEDFQVISNGADPRQGN